MSEYDEELTEYEKKKDGWRKQLTSAFFSNGKWIFFSILGIGYLIVYTGVLPQDDLMLLAIVTSGSVAIGIVILFVWIDSKWDKRREKRDKLTIKGLENKQDAMQEQLNQITITLTGSVRALENYTDRGTFDFDISSGLFLHVNPNFVDIIGWNARDLNNEIRRFEILGRPTRIAETLFEKEYVVEMAQMLEKITEHSGAVFRFTDIKMLHKDGSHVPVDFVIDNIGIGDNVIAKGFITSNLERDHQRATESNLVSLTMMLTKYFTSRKDKFAMREEMTKHLEEMRKQAWKN